MSKDCTPEIRTQRFVPVPPPDTIPQGIYLLNPSLFQPASTLPELQQKIYFFNACLSDIDAAWVEFNFVNLRINTFGLTSEEDNQQFFTIGGRLCDAAVNAIRAREAIFASPIFMQEEWGETRLTTAEPYLTTKGICGLRFIERVLLQNTVDATHRELEV